jgi:hypothetical protein
MMLRISRLVPLAMGVSSPHLRQGLLEVGDDVGLVLDAYGLISPATLAASA